MKKQHQRENKSVFENELLYILSTNVNLLLENKHVCKTANNIINNRYLHFWIQTVGWSCFNFLLLLQNDDIKG